MVAVLLQEVAVEVVAVEVVAVDQQVNQQVDPEALRVV
jgi:hypothetical protein